MRNSNFWSKLFIINFWSSQCLRLLRPCRDKRECWEFKHMCIKEYANIWLVKLALNLIDHKIYLIDKVFLKRVDFGQALLLTSSQNKRPYCWHRIGYVSLIFLPLLAMEITKSQKEGPSWTCFDRHYVWNCKMSNVKTVCENLLNSILELLSMVSFVVV